MQQAPEWTDFLGKVEQQPQEQGKESTLILGNLEELTKIHDIRDQCRNFLDPYR